jgi:hypothetical protein
LILWPLFAPGGDRDGTFFWFTAAALTVCAALGFTVCQRFEKWVWLVPVVVFGLCIIAFATARGAVREEFIVRYINAGSQISPLVPMLLVSLSVVWWLWYNISACVLSDVRRPQIPALADDLPRHLTDISREEQGRLESVMIPGHMETRIWVPLVGLGIFLLLLAGPHRLLWSFERSNYDWLLTLLLAASFALLAESLLRILIVWTEAKRLLRGLNNQPFRSSISLVSGITWTSIWRVGTGSLTAAHSLFIREIEALSALAARLKSQRQEASQTYGLLLLGGKLVRRRGNSSGPDRVREEVVKLVDVNSAATSTEDLAATDGIANTLVPQAQLEKVWNEYVSILDKRRKSKSVSARRMQRKEAALLKTYGELQSGLAKSAALLLSILNRYYHEHPQPTCEPDHECLKEAKEQVPKTSKELAEHFVSMVYINYIVTILLRIRTLAAAAAGIFVFDVLALNSYPFEPQAALRSLMFAIFVAITACFALVYGQMHRDPILSRMTDTKAGELGGDFWFRMLSLTGLPIASLLATQFPSIGNFLFSWIEPVLKTAR